MSLRTKLLLAQLPLGAALVVLGVVAVWSIFTLGHESQRVLSANYRSVLAAQEMKEAGERMDSAALFAVAGRHERAAAQIAGHRERFDKELRTAEGNITEAGEPAALKELRRSWMDYQAELDRYLTLTDRQAQEAAYFRELEPVFLAVKAAADRLLDINQDAMLRRSDEARRLARRTSVLLGAAAIGALVLGLLLSTSLTRRLLRPLSVLTQAVARLGEGDFRARARIGLNDEVGRLAGQFNRMADRLAEYQESSLGELLLAQRASRAVINSLDDPVVIFDREGLVLEMNQPAAALMPPGQQGQAEVKGIALPELREAITEASRHVLQGRGPRMPRGFEDAIAVTTPSGRRQYSLRAAPVYEDVGGIAGATLILQDVTKFYRLDELKNDLVATVAHEFRTPLTSLRMAIHLCLEGIAGPLTEKQADLLQTGREDCQRLQATVDELLDLARLQAGQIEIRPEPAPAASLLEEAADSFRRAADDKQQRLEVAALGSTRAVLADRERIPLVLSNLISNAIRHTPEGGSITLRAVDQDQFVRFEVSDTGEGVPEEHRQAIFERFYRVPGSHSGAVGLGLSLVRDVVTAHGGHVGVDSRPDAGSTFWFTLPVTAERPVSLDTAAKPRAGQCNT
ncbi:MAG: HAMP domain-containing protein [Pirellulales bacterium]|nr:HAMP domain-containing protein [Pirellulales bacterium]